MGGKGEIKLGVGRELGVEEEGKAAKKRGKNEKGDTITEIEREREVNRKGEEKDFQHQGICKKKPWGWEVNKKIK